MKPGRKSETTVTSEVGSSRKAKIASMFAGGATQLAVWRGMEVEYPETITDNATRAEVCKELGIPCMPFNPEERERLGWAIRQIKGLMLKENAEQAEVLDAVGAGDAESPSDIAFTNRRRFLCGVPALDMIYGKTIYRWLTDAPNSKYKTEKFTVNIKGEDVVKEREVWASGSYKAGDMMPFTSRGNQSWTPQNGESYTVLDSKLAYVEHGFCESFLSLWGGAPGVGKTRLAIATGKASNSLGHKVLYFNGEADKEDFRSWLGADVDDDLFRVSSGEMIRTEDAVEQIFKHTPKIVIFDSLQMLAEVEKGSRGTKTAISRFKVLKSDEDAGRPHIIFISQLNKKNELAGSRYLEHMVDLAAHVKKVEGRKKQFLFEVPRKNRGGETGIGLPFEHTDTGVRCIATDPNLRTEPIYKSLTQVTTPAISQGVGSPSIE